MKLLLYLVTNLFLWYVLFRFVAMFYRKPSRLPAYARACLFVLAVGINSLLALIFDNPILNLASTVTLLFIWTFQYEDTVLKRIASIAIPYGSIMLLDNMVAGIGNLIIQTRIMAYNNLYTALLAFFFVIALEKLFDKKLDYQLSLIHWFAIFTMPFGSILIVAVALEKQYESIATLTVISVLLLFNAITFYLYDVAGKYYQGQNEKRLIVQQNRSYANQLTIITEASRKISHLRHDAKNHLTVIGSMVEDGRLDELKVYINSINESLKPNKEVASSGNRDVDSLLNYKYAEAASFGITMSISVKIPKEPMQIQDFDIVTIVGNLLDNAIEACRQEENSSIVLEILYEKGVLFITSKNDCTMPPKIQGDKIITTKTDKANHGIGLDSIKYTAGKYDGAINIQHKDRKFIAQVFLYDIPEKADNITV